ncbi:conserved hypothetical protein [Prosthecochloris aestuarii DSM 271]|uniref:DUF2269 domain-containing protein n=1 Tax=Prosthecochloris aestuarii (strain DSM 271 / SK 413) TaxID=290512 RepID=B4S7J1_PROA2|nr:hypothetical protein [Prosthecochloris aestuarii]ACF46028.1 conserved hypothetical protein [Prosthecochloris aestuarii DSM 271]
MKKMTPSQQKFLKFLHLVTAGLWLSCVFMLAMLPIIAMRLSSGDEIYLYNLVYHFIDMFILTPAAVLTLCTGLCYSLFTHWGFIRHGWLIYKWIVTLTIVVTGTVYLGPLVSDLLDIANTERIAALQNPYYIQGQTIGIAASILNTILLLAAVLVSVYKPWKNLK